MLACLPSSAACSAVWKELTWDWCLFVAQKRATEGCSIGGSSWIPLMCEAGHEFVKWQANGDVPREARNAPRLVERSY